MKRIVGVLMGLLLLLFSPNSFAEEFVEFRFVCGSDGIDCEEVFNKENNENLLIERDAVLSLSDIAKAEVVEQKIPQYFVNTLEKQGPIQYFINIKFTSEGAKKLRAITEENLKRRLAIFIGGKFIMAPQIYEPIMGGQVQVSRQFNREKIAEMVEQINSKIANE